VVELIKDDLRRDVESMRTVANDESNYKDIENLDLEENKKKELTGKVKSQILSGEDKIASQNLESLKGA